MTRRLHAVGFVLGVAALAALASPLLSVGALTAREPAPQASAPARAPAESDRPKSQPYAGDLSIFEDPQRAEKLHVDRVMDVLAIREGSRVADVGAGSGWFTVRAARRAGASGKVFAVDINRDYLDYIAKRATKEGLGNVETVLGTEDDAKLPSASVDAVLILKTYHEIARPVTLMSRLRPALRPGALVGIIDREGKGDDHGISDAVVVSEMGRAGYALKDRYDFVKPDGMDYFLVFTAADAPASPAR